MMAIRRQSLQGWRQNSDKRDKVSARCFLESSMPNEWHPIRMANLLVKFVAMLSVYLQQLDFRNSTLAAKWGPVNKSV